MSFLFLFLFPSPRRKHILRKRPRQIGDFGSAYATHAADTNDRADYMDYRVKATQYSAPVCGLPSPACFGVCSLASD